MRLAALALASILFIGVVAAVGCGSLDTNVFVGSSVGACEAPVTCHRNLCACLGVTFNSDERRCVGAMPPTVSCGATAVCHANLLSCLYTAAKANGGGNVSAGTGCSLWALNVHVDMLAVESGTPFPSTSIATGCAQLGCVVQNTSFCPSAVYTCRSPIERRFTATIRLSGSHWATVLLNASARLQVRLLVETLLTSRFGHPCNVTGLRAGSLIIDFEADTPPSEAMSELLTALQTQPTWIAALAELYQALGGTDALTVLSVTEVNPTVTEAPGLEKEGCTAACIVGIAVGAVALICLVLAVVLIARFCCKRRRNGTGAKKTEPDGV